MSERALAIDLYTGLHGWAEGLIAAGWRVIGFDLHDMSKLVGEPLPPEHFSLVLQDVLTLHGSQFKDAELIVGSSPCQEFSYRAMPWKRAKALGPPELGMRLFKAQFRIQREASEAAGRYIPLVVENVRGAQPWVGKARANFGSYYLWGDLPALMPITPRRMRHKSREGEQWNINRKNFTGTLGWDETPRDDDGRKLPGFRFDGSGRSFQTAAINEHMKTNGGIPHIRDGHAHTRHLTNPAEHGDEAVKLGGSWFHGYQQGQGPRNHGSGSKARKASSAKIAKIPFTLAHWIGRAWLPLQAAA